MGIERHVDAPKPPVANDPDGPSEEFKAALWEKIKRPAEGLPDYGTWDELGDEVDDVSDPSTPPAPRTR